MNSKAILLLSVLILIFPELTFAHGDNHTEEHSPQLTEEPVPVKDSIYSIDTVEDPALSNLEETTMNSPFSSINTLGDDDPLINRDIKINDPMKRFKKEGEHSSEQHGQHKKQHVEEALHEWVSSEAKGREVAISISILSGLAFMGLCFFKIGEGNKNNTTDY